VATPAADQQLLPGVTLLFLLNDADGPAARRQPQIQALANEVLAVAHHLQPGLPTVKVAAGINLEASRVILSLGRTLSPFAVFSFADQLNMVSIECLCISAVLTAIASRSIVSARGVQCPSRN
jgi:hypothetical protein